MTARLFITAFILAVAAVHPSANAENADPIPASFTEQIPLIQKASDTDVEMAYQINMRLRDYYKKAPDAKFRDALLGWVQRSSGITLKFNLDSWNHARKRADAPLSSANVEMLISIVKNTKPDDLTPRDWAYKTGHDWPCRTIADPAGSILGYTSAEHRDLLFAELNDPDDVMRATFTNILGHPSERTLTLTQERRLSKLHQDPSPKVRTAVATNLWMDTSIPATELKKLLMTLLDDTDQNVRSAAFRAIYHHPDIFNANDVAKLANLAEGQLPPNDLAILFLTLQDIAKTEAPRVCDELIKHGIRLLDGEHGLQKKDMHRLFGIAARFASQNQVDLVAARLCSDNKSFSKEHWYETTEAIQASGHRFPKQLQITVVEDSLQHMKSDVESVRLQAGDTAGFLIKSLTAADQKTFVKALIDMLPQPKTVQASLQALKIIGSDAHAAIPDVKTLTELSEDKLRVSATATLWSIAQDSDTCVPIMLSYIDSDEWFIEDTAHKTLIKSGASITRFRPLVHAALEDTKTTHSMLRVLYEIGTPAKPLADLVEDVAETGHRRYQNYAKRVFKAISS